MSESALEFSYGQYEIVYNVTSLVLAAMGAATIFFWFQVSQVAKPFKNALLVSASVTLIACYHYFRIFNSFTEAYKAGASNDGTMIVIATGLPFNDAYRYVDWLLTVPLLLIELILVMQLSPEETTRQCFKLGGLAALMVILGYPGEVSTDNGIRWLFWCLAMLPFLVIVYTLFVGLKSSVEQQPSEARGLVSASRYVTVLSWCTYPVVFVFPMLGLTGASAATAVQVGYSIADLIAKPIVGMMVWRIAVAKGQANLIDNQE